MGKEYKDLENIFNKDNEPIFTDPPYSVLSQNEVDALLKGIEGGDMEDDFHIPDELILEEYFEAKRLLIHAISSNFTNNMCLDLIKLAKDKYRKARKEGFKNFS